MSLHVVFEQSTNPSIVTEPAVVLVNEQFELYFDTDIDEALLKTAKEPRRII